MNILEKEIEDVIFDAIEFFPKTLIDRGLQIPEEMNYVRQPDLGSYGRADIVGFRVYPKERGRRMISVHILEIKKDQINLDTLKQAVRYARAIQRLVKQKLKGTWVNINISLIGKTIDTKSDFVYLSDVIYEVNCYTYTVDLYKGIRFTNENGYFLTNENFPNLSEYKSLATFQLEESLKNSEEQPF